MITSVFSYSSGSSKVSSAEVFANSKYAHFLKNSTLQNNYDPWEHIFYTSPP